MNLFDFTGKVAVVSGASSGIGKATALAYADCGAKVAVLARRKEKLEDVVNEIKSKGGEAIAIQCDVADEESVKNAIEEVKETFGRIDILFNNAGIAQPGSVETLTVEEWDRSMDTNIKGAYLAMKYALPIMKENNYGKIVNTASVNAVLYEKNSGLVRHVYNVSKMALIGLTKTTAASYGQYGITVNSIGPGLFETEMTEGTLFKHEAFLKGYNMSNPVGRPGKMEEVVGTVLYFSSDASNYVTGEFLLVDGGMTLV